VSFLDDKSDVFNIFKVFSKRVKKELELEIKKVRSDNENEFKNARVDEYCNDQGFKHEFVA